MGQIGACRGWNLSILYARKAWDGSFGILLCGFVHGHGLVIQVVEVVGFLLCQNRAESRTRRCLRVRGHPQRFGSDWASRCNAGRHAREARLQGSTHPVGLASAGAIMKVCALLKPLGSAPVGTVPSIKFNSLGLSGGVPTKLFP